MGVRLASAVSVALVFVSCVGVPNTVATFGSSPSVSPEHTPSATATRSPLLSSGPSASPSPEILVAADAWTKLRASLPTSVAVPTPTWLPDGLDAKVALSGVSATAYALTYLRNGDATLRFAGGVSTDSLGSSIGTRVRGVGASISFPTTLYQLPAGARVLRRVAWHEGGTGYTIESEVLTGDTLLHVAWSLDRTGVPHPFPRTAVGSCASATSPVDTVRNWVLALGRHSPDTILDCFADDSISDGILFADMQADQLPTATVDRLGPTSAIGGRVWVPVSWSFTSDPGDRYVQGQHASLNYIVGLEDGLYRIFEGGTGAYAPPP